MDKMLELYVATQARWNELLEQPERGDGPVDNAWIIAGGVAAAGILVAAIAAAVSNRVGQIN